jgi:hypothetical protein
MSKMYKMKHGNRFSNWEAKKKYKFSNLMHIRFKNDRPIDELEL